MTADLGGFTSLISHYIKENAVITPSRRFCGKSDV
jgi:hypothetical protein